MRVESEELPLSEHAWLERPPWAPREPFRLVPLPPFSQVRVLPRAPCPFFLEWRGYAKSDHAQQVAVRPG